MNYLISEMDARAHELARAWGAGVETIAFCAAENLSDEKMIAEARDALSAYPFFTMHGPFYEMAPCAIDPMIRDVAMHRFRQAADVCRRIGAQKLILHSGYAPQVYYPIWFTEKSIPFWREFLATQPEDFSLAIENVLDVDPKPIRDVLDGIGDARAKICLDTGHANCYSPVPIDQWIDMLGDRIGHVHLHNNSGARDEHLRAGSMNLSDVARCIREAAPDADICIESMEAEKFEQLIGR